MTTNYRRSRGSKHHLTGKDPVGQVQVRITLFRKGRPVKRARTRSFTIERGRVEKVTATLKRALGLNPSLAYRRPR